MNRSELLELLEAKAREFNHPSFIENDPISIPHQFSKLQDIEITAFFAAMLAWGLRKTIINKCKELIQLMDNAPYEFIVGHQPSDLKRFTNFKHRTFNYTDTLYFITFLSHYYNQHHSLENAFVQSMNENDEHVGNALAGFHRLFFSLPDFPQRTRKHIATPERKSTCKRLNMYLRWMVRQDDKGVDFGLWKRIKPFQLLCPLDVHVDRVARKLGLIQRKQKDWQTVKELTANLRSFDPLDPVKYDFALFGIGVIEKSAFR